LTGDDKMYEGNQGGRWGSDYFAQNVAQPFLVNIT
jgi:hypothetical protein